MSTVVSPLAQMLLDANDESRQFIAEIDSALGMPALGDQPGLRLSRAVTETLVSTTQDALASGDVVAMIRAANAHGLAWPRDEVAS